MQIYWIITKSLTCLTDALLVISNTMRYEWFTKSFCSCWHRSSIMFSHYAIYQWCRGHTFPTTGNVGKNHSWLLRTIVNMLIHCTYCNSIRLMPSYCIYVFIYKSSMKFDKILQLRHHHHHHHYHHSLLRQMAAEYKIQIKHNKSSANLQHNEVSKIQKHTK